MNTKQGCESSSVQLISSFLKIFLCQNFNFFFYFQPRLFLAFYPDFTVFFLVFCMWPLTPLTKTGTPFSDKPELYVKGSTGKFEEII